MKRIILLLLALVMVVSVFAACGDSTGASTPNKTTPRPGGTTDPGDKEVPETEKMNLDLESIDWEGETVYVYHWVPDAGLEEFGMESDQINNDAVNDAIYKRNSYTEEALGITIDWYKQANSGYRKVKNFVDKLTARKDDIQTPVDIVAGQTRCMPFVMVEGLLTDLNTYSDSLDLGKAWWPQDVRELHEIKGNLYFISGDISANLLRMMTVLFVNKKMLDTLGHDYTTLMEQVKANEWTLDELISLTTGVYQDLDTATPGPSLGDKFGLVTTYFHSDGLFAGLGYKYMIASSKDNEVFRLSNQMVTATSADYVTKMKNWNETNDFHMDPLEKTYQESFKNGDSLFILHRAWFGFELQKTEVQYAVLPTPALDSAQGRYYTTIGNQYTSYGICSASLEYDRAAQALQTLGYYAKSTTTPALFEVSFQGKFSKDDYTIEMFNIIRESVTFDIGRIYDVYIAGNTGEYAKYILPNIVSYPIRNMETYNFNSGSDAVRRVVNGYIDDANAKLLQFVEALG